MRARVKWLNTQTIYRADFKLRVRDGRSCRGVIAVKVDLVIDRWRTTIDKDVAAEFSKHSLDVASEKRSQWQFTFLIVSRIRYDILRPFRRLRAYVQLLRCDDFATH